MNAWAQDSLTDQLKQIDESLPTDSKAILLKAAELVDLLDYMQLHGVAAVAADHEQWTQAGFYFIAASMRFKVDAYVNDLTKPKALKEMISGQSDRQRVKQLAFELRKDPIFKKLNQRSQQATDLTQNNQLIKLYLLRHSDVLTAATEMYALWRPTYSDSYVSVMPSEARLTPSEADQTFAQLNEVYLQSNQDILKLMENPRYQQLMIEKEQAFIAWSSEVLKSGKFKKDRVSIDQINQGSREIERIEMEMLLFPETDWGWFR